eukprot:jgi/Picsp_1/4537/NSC_06758-R1_glycosyltransferase 25 family member 3-like
MGKKKRQNSSNSRKDKIAFQSNSAVFSIVLYLIFATIALWCDSNTMQNLATLIKPNVPIFVINLERRLDRREKCIQRLKFLSDLRFIDAIDGRDIENSDKVMSSPLGAGEVACFLSHGKALDAIVKSRSPLALVIEDDVQFVNEFSAKSIYRIQSSLPSDWDAVSLGCNQYPPVGTQRKDLAVNLKPLKDIAVDLYGAYATLYSRKGALKLSNKIKKANITLPYDIWLGRAGASIYVTVPALANVTSFGDSDTVSSNYGVPTSQVLSSAFITRYLPGSQYVTKNTASFSLAQMSPSAKDLFLATLENGFENRLGFLPSDLEAAYVIQVLDFTNGLEWNQLLVHGSLTAMKLRYSRSTPLVFAGSSRIFGIYVIIYESLSGK